MEANTCCFIGHRKLFDNIEILKSTLYQIIEKLVVEQKVDTFLFGSKSQFNTICHQVVTKIKEKYPHIKRVYVRAEYQYIDEEYKNFILQDYEDTYYPEKIRSSGRAAYVERNYEMINDSQICVMYYDRLVAPITRKSGTKIAFEYATKRGKKIINVAEVENI